VEDLQKQHSDEKFESKWGDEKQKVTRTTEHALKAALQKESCPGETLLAEKKQLVMLTAPRRLPSRERQNGQGKPGATDHTSWT
jgi:acyl-homoserine lactone acylase PvdQ